MMDCGGSVERHGLGGVVRRRVKRDGRTHLEDGDEQGPN
jgi:hypothetical protein